MGALDAFRDAHADLLAALGDPAAWTFADGTSATVQALLDRHTAEIGEYGQTVAYRPSIAALSTDVANAGRGDIVTIAGEQWQVVRAADADGMVTRFWVEPAP